MANSELYSPQQTVPRPARSPRGMSPGGHDHSGPAIVMGAAPRPVFAMAGEQKQVIAYALPNLSQSGMNQAFDGYVEAIASQPTPTEAAGALAVSSAVEQPATQA